MCRWAGSMSGLKSLARCSSWVRPRSQGNMAASKSPLAKCSGWLRCWASACAVAGKGTKRARAFCGSVLSKASTLSGSMPGTSQSSRSWATRLSATSGSRTVMPSRASPGSCKYVTGQSMPPSRIRSGNAACVTASAVCRIKSSGVSTKACARCAWGNWRSHARSWSRLLMSAGSAAK